MKTYGSQSVTNEQSKDDILHVEEANIVVGRKTVYVKCELVRDVTSPFSKYTVKFKIALGRESSFWLYTSNIDDITDFVKHLTTFVTDECSIMHKTFEQSLKRYDVKAGAIEDVKREDDKKKQFEYIKRERDKSKHDVKQSIKS